MGKPWLLDLYCGAGGAARGYQQAGFLVCGVDVEPQPRYVGDDFIQCGALALLVILLDGGGVISRSEQAFFLHDFAAIHASPPCQGYMQALAAKDGRHPMLIEPTRKRILRTKKPYIIENVDGARFHLRHPMRLCGSNFALGVRRHRFFECEPELQGAGPCNHRSQERIRAYYGDHSQVAWTPRADRVQRIGRGDPTRQLLRGSTALAAEDMGIDWMNWDELREAVPPAYTQHLGEQLIEVLRATPTKGVFA